MNGRVRVLIADDHPATRAGVRDALETADFEVCGEAATASAAVEAALQHEPDLCLLDIRMPGSGIEAAGAIARALPATRIVMLTVSRDDEDLFAALRAGAIGYLLKDLDRRRLVEALREVVAGDAALPPSLVARLVEEFRRRETRKARLLRTHPNVTLRPREWQVLELLHDGESTAEIALRLGVAEVTVRTHVASLLRKLRVPDRRAAARLLDD